MQQLLMISLVILAHMFLFTSSGAASQSFTQEVDLLIQKLKKENAANRTKIFTHFISDLEKREIATKPDVEKAIADADNDIAQSEAQEMLHCIPKESLSHWPNKAVCMSFKPCVVKEFNQEPKGLKQMQELLIASGCKPVKTHK